MESKQPSKLKKLQDKIEECDSKKTLQDVGAAIKPLDPIIPT